MKTMFPLSVVLVLVLVSLALLAGCGGEATPVPTAADQPSGSNEQIVIGLSQPSLAWPYTALHTEVFRAEAEKAGVEVIVMDGADDAAKQANQMDDLIAKKVDVIVVDPLDAKAIVSSIKKAREAGIPVVHATVFPDAEALPHIATLVSYNNEKEGALAAQMIAKGLNNKGKVAIIEGFTGAAPQLFRTKGFEEEIAKIAPDIEVVAKQSAYWDKAKAMALMEDWVVRYQDLSGVVAQDDPMAMGAIEAIRAAGKADKILVTGNDGQPDALEFIKQGMMYGSIKESPTLDAQLSLKVAVDIANGRQVEKAYYLDTPIVTSENVEEFIGKPW